MSGVQNDDRRCGNPVVVIVLTSLVSSRVNVERLKRPLNPYFSLDFNIRPIKSTFFASPIPLHEFARLPEGQISKKAKIGQKVTKILCR